MSALYGTLKGCRGAATRCGTKNSGIQAAVQSYNGSIITKLDYKEDGTLLVKIGAAYGKSTTEMDELLFCGTINELKEKLNRA